MGLLFGQSEEADSSNLKPRSPEPYDGEPASTISFTSCHGPGNLFQLQASSFGGLLTQSLPLTTIAIMSVGSHYEALFRNYR